jgi:hypothetical protein
MMGSDSVAFRNVPSPVGIRTMRCVINTDERSASPDFISASAIACASFRDMLFGSIGWAKSLIDGFFCGSAALSVSLGGKLLPPLFIGVAAAAVYIALSPSQSFF